MDLKIGKLLAKNNILVDEHKLVKPEVKVNKYAIYSYIAFGIVLVVFLIDILTNIDLKMNGFLVYIALSLLVIYPLTTRDNRPKEFLIITPLGLVKAVDKEVTYIEFDNINRYKFDDLNIYISQGKELISLSRDIYKEVLEVIVDILEAKGKTFDSSKDYMIRNIDIVIRDEEIKLIEIEEVSMTEKITGKLLGKYKHLTPGFIDYVIPRNSIVTNILIVDNHLDIKVSTLQIKNGHPENTTFDMQEVSDCIFTFENARIAQYAVKQSNEKNAPFELKDITVEDLTEVLKDSVIDDWQYGTNELIFIFKVGIGNIKIHLKYDEIIVGWNKVK